MTRLSVITINYNNKNGLERTIKSVLSQNYQDLEYIIVDGGSTDGSIDVIKAHDAKITKWISEKDSGIYNAMNKGLKMATGEYCLFLNSGDTLVNEKVLERVFSKQHREDILYGDMMVDWGKGKITHEKMHKSVSLYEMYTDTIWHPAAFIRRELFIKYGNYDESYKIVADYEFFFRVVIEKKVSLEYLPVPISVFEFNGLSSLPENKSKEQEERKKVWKNYLSGEQIMLMEEKLKNETAKKKTLYHRIINKLKF